MITLHEGDNRVSLRRLINDGVKVHSVVTDPPYGLTSIAKRFGKEGAAPARTEKNDGSFARLSGGFMGKAWDGTGIERDPEFWRLIWEILLPGGYCFAFSGSRTGHWQAVAMEQAGFVMHPMHGWVFGSGFPKAHAADKAIDKALGVKGGIGEKKANLNSRGSHQMHEGWHRPWMDDSEAVEAGMHHYVPGSPEAEQWQGWAYGTQAQKPALEPIYLAQKPFSEKTGAANLLKHGVGAVNIDGCRVPTNPAVDDPRLGGAGCWKTDKAAQNVYEGGYAGQEIASSTLGRHPANLMHDGSAEVIELFPGGNARFFNCFPPDADPIFYQAKAGKEDRAGGKHPTVKPIALMQHLIRHVTPPGGVVLDPFAGSGTTAEAARREGFDCIIMEAEPDYVGFLKQRFRIEDLEEDLLNEQVAHDPLAELLG